MMIRPKVISRIPFPPKRILKVMDGVTVPERLALLQVLVLYYVAVLLIMRCFRCC